MITGLYTVSLKSITGFIGLPTTQTTVANAQLIMTSSIIEGNVKVNCKFGNPRIFQKYAHFQAKRLLAFCPYVVTGVVVVSTK